MNRVNQRVAVLIDTQNMYHSAKHLHGARLAFGKVVEAMAEGRPVIRAIAYVAKSKTGEEQGFFDAMTEMGIELKIKDIQEFSSGEKKADWDVGIAVDAVKLADKVDVIVLMTGDGDFVPLVEYLHGRGVIVEVAAFGESTNALLKTVVDRFFDISEHRDLLIGAKFFHRQQANRGTEKKTTGATFGIPPELGLGKPKKPLTEEKGKPRAGAGGVKRVRVTY